MALAPEKAAPVPLTLGKMARASDAVDPVPLTLGRRFLFGGLVVGIMLIGGFAWASFVPLASAIVAQGTIVVEGSRKPIQHLEGGIVAEILVKEDDHVEAGQVLIRLDPTQSQARMSAVSTRLATLQATQVRLAAEEAEAETLVFPDWILAEAAANAETAAAVEGQQRVFAARRSALIARLEPLDRQIDQLGDQIRGLEIQRTSRLRQLALIREELTGLRQLHAQGYAPRTRVLALEREVERLSGEAGEALQRKAAAEAQIEQTRAEKLRMIEEFRESVVTERRDTEDRIAEQLQEQVIQNDILTRVDIVAPYSGRVLGLSKQAINSVIAPGEEILEIVPIDDELVTDVRVLPQDIDKLRVGLEAQVLFTAFDLNETPRLTGSVARFSADRLIDDATGEAYFLARIAVPVDELGKLEDLDLYAGMPVEAHLKTGERTAMSYLLRPITDRVRRAMREE